MPPFFMLKLPAASYGKSSIVWNYIYFLIRSLFWFNLSDVPHLSAVQNCLNHKRDMCKGAFMIYKCKGQPPNCHLAEDVWVHSDTPPAEWVASGDGTPQRGRFHWGSPVGAIYSSKSNPSCSFSSFSCSRMYLRIVFSSNPTVLTQYPLAQNRSMDQYRTLAFQKPYYKRYTILRCNP